MEVIDGNVTTLSNYEVFSLLKDLQSGEKGQRKPGRKQQNLATISYETVKYLEKTPCQHQSDEIIQKVLLALKPYKLTKAEKLQLLNHRPTTAVEIQLLIEESEERLSEEQIEELLQVVREHLPGEEEEADGEEQTEEMEQDS